LDNALTDNAFRLSHYVNPVPWTGLKSGFLISCSHPASEGSMQDYEILILNQDHHPSAMVEMMEASDASAIRSAMRIANGRDIEVWRDLDCVYRTPHAPGRSAAA
jgi:hypothetical protein